MKIRSKATLLGCLFGCIGLFFILPYHYLTNTAGDKVLIFFFPLSLAFMMTEFFSPFLSALFFICLLVFNLGMFGGFGYFLGLTIEAVKAKSTFKKKMGVLIGYLLLSFFVFILLLGCGLSFTFVVQEFLVNWNWLKGTGYFLILAALFIGITSLFKIFSRKAKFRTSA